MHAEWVLGSKRAGIRLHFAPSDEEALSGHVAFPPLAFYWGLDAPWLRKLISRIAGGATDISEKYGSRELALRFHDWTLWWDLWVDPGGWTNKRPRWRDGNFCLPDFVLGKAKYMSVEIENRPIVVPMPEGVYRGVCRLTEDTWKRPRWRALRMRRCDIKMQDPIPKPGKGENSWDCGQDATHGLTAPANNYAEAISAIVGCVMRDREKYGGPDYVPLKNQPAKAS
jgi:hypothetical protein